MKNLLYLSLLPLFLINCKKKEPEPLPAVKEILGKWRLEAVLKAVNGQAIWEIVNKESVYSLIIRYDGVVLDGDGLGACCPSDSLVVNGKAFKIEPKEAIPRNPACNRIDCIACPSLELEQDGKELIVRQRCSYLNYSYKYSRG